MKFVELTVNTTNEAEDLVADIFWNYTDYGVAISSAYDATKLADDGVIFDYADESVFADKKGVSLVKGYFPLESEKELSEKVRLDLENLRSNAVMNVGTLETVKRTVDADDWVQMWKKHFKPIPFGKVTICPQWIKCDNDGIVIKIDSDMAFGTGEHETTSMVIEEMQKYLPKANTVLDVGTGSGILGVTAAKLGASKVVMTDIDETAVSVAKKNAELNNVSDRCSILCAGDLETVDGKFEIVLANITAEILSFLSKDISSKTAEKGILIMSGILNDRAEKVEKIFNENGLTLVSKKSVGEWSCLVMKKLCVS